MARMSDIKRWGELLRMGSKKHFSTLELHDFLREESGSFHVSTLADYMEQLKRMGYIRFNHYHWEVIE